MDGMETGARTEQNETQRACARVVSASHRLLNERLVARTWGNVSCRVSADQFVITPSGLGYEGMTADDIVLYRMQDKTWSGTRKPSSEKGVHAAAYRRFPDAGFVIHTHQTFASALSVAGFDAWKRSAEDEIFLGGVALASYGLPGTKTLVNAVERALSGGAHTILMAHHGALLVGRDENEAFSRAERLEALCKAACLGQPDDAAGDERALTALLPDQADDYAVSVEPAIIAVSRGGKPVFAQLDDMAQMIGRRITLVSSDKARVAAALQKRDVVLVAGLGAICRAETAGDREALRLLTAKAAVVCLNTRACKTSGRLGALDTALMRFVYRKKYARKIGG